MSPLGVYRSGLRDLARRGPVSHGGHRGRVRVRSRLAIDGVPMFYGPARPSATSRTTRVAPSRSAHRRATGHPRTSTLCGASMEVQTRERATEEAEGAGAYRAAWAFVARTRRRDRRARPRTRGRLVTGRRSARGPHSAADAPLHRRRVDGSERGVLGRRRGCRQWLPRLTAGERNRVLAGGWRVVSVRAGLLGHLRCGNAFRGRRRRSVSGQRVRPGRGTRGTRHLPRRSVADDASRRVSVTLPIHYQPPLPASHAV